MSKFMNYWEKGIECTLCKISVPCEVSYEINFNKRKLVKETKDFFLDFEMYVIQTREMIFKQHEKYYLLKKVKDKKYFFIW